MGGGNQYAIEDVGQKLTVSHLKDLADILLEAHFDLMKVGLNNIHPAVTSIMACASILKHDTIKG